MSNQSGKRIVSDEAIHKDMTPEEVNQAAKRFFEKLKGRECTPEELKVFGELSRSEKRSDPPFNDPHDSENS